MKTHRKKRPYKYLGKRVENTACGKLGRIARAERRTDVKHGWNVWIAWDDGRVSGYWTDRDIGKSALNRVVTDDYKPDYGPIKDRIKALLAKLDEGTLEWRMGMITTIYVGKDNVGIWRPCSTFIASAHLWAGQGDWEGEGKTAKEARESLRKKLVELIRHEL